MDRLTKSFPVAVTLFMALALAMLMFHFLFTAVPWLPLAMSVVVSFALMWAFIYSFTDEDRQE